MYDMKKIIRHDENIVLPKCMYNMKNILTDLRTEIENNENEEHSSLNIRKQVIKFLQIPVKSMTELENRQDQLLKKLDVLYARIQSLSSICNNSTEVKKKPTNRKPLIEMTNEVVLTVNVDKRPWYIIKILKELDTPVNIVWHIHSTVGPENVHQIMTFVKNIETPSKSSKTSLRLIFKNDSSDPELKLTSLNVPIVGNVNILRYLSLLYPNVIPYDFNDITVDSLLDLCYLLEKSSEKNKETLVKKIFDNYSKWIHNGTFSIIDLAAYNVVKQWKVLPKYVPKEWFDKMNTF